MNYELLLNEILNIGKELLKSGAEIDRVEDSIYRMVESYQVKQCNVFAIQSNIQVTVELPDGHFITQIRRIHRVGNNYERLDHLNDLSRYISRNTPPVDEIREKYKEIMERKQQPVYLSYLSTVMGGIGFAVYFGCDFTDIMVGIVVCAAVEAYLGDILGKREQNLVVYNIVIAFLSAVAVFFAFRLGLGHHPNRIVLGLNMVLVSGLGVTNGIRDVLNRSYLSGILNVLNACLGAVGIACGTGLAIILFKGNMDAQYVSPSALIQIIGCGVGSLGFALMFKASVRHSLVAGLGALLNYGSYLVVLHFQGSNFLAVLVSAALVAVFAYIMSRIYKAPSTIFLTTAILPMVPGSALFYMMYGLTQADYGMAKEQVVLIGEICLAIAFGFLVVEIATRYLKRNG
ncbi:MAG: threonine/serine exporter family protein [Coprococcus sp.]|nr:threonine/serine exporter family protein [Coprococcus sp.]